jgi:sugar lactone lactonase YvrE
MNKSLMQERRCAWRLAALLLTMALTACGGGGGGDSTPIPPPPPAIVAPSITSQPQAATASDGATASFSVNASGSSLSYQWQRDGQNIPGATSASYTTPVLRYADNGAKFQVVVSGPNTSVTSSSVSLTVTPLALSLTTQPQAQTAKDGEVVSFDVGATGSQPVQYQWLRNGTPIAGATQATYTTAALTLTDDGALFKVVLTNPAGSVTSQEARLQVSPVPPRVVTAPESVTTTDGASVTFKVVAAGSAPLAYQWLRNGQAIVGATGASWAVTLDMTASGDRYAVQISNQAGQLTSAAATVTVDPAAPSISRHPADTTITTGGSASFGVVAGGTAPLSYQWQQSTDAGLTWTPISGATTNSYSVSNATLADADTRLRVAVRNAAATLVSNPARLTVQPKLRIFAGVAGGAGYAEGKGQAARFRDLNGLTGDANNNVYVADSGSHVFRRIGPDGKTSLLAGGVGQAGWTNGSAAQARFVIPTEVVADRSGMLYLADVCTIRKFVAGEVSPFVGNPSCQSQDGTGQDAGFGQILGMVQDPDGNLFVTERTRNGQVLRKVTPTGTVSTVAGSASESGLADGVGTAARFTSLSKLAIDANRNLYLADGNGIRLVSPTMEVSLYAGSPVTAGDIEGDRKSARFYTVSGLAFDARGNLWVSDPLRLSRITPAGNVATATRTLYDSNGRPLSRDGVGQSASVVQPGPLASMPSGAIALADRGDFTVRLVTPNASVMTLAGGGLIRGFADGAGGSARFGWYTFFGVDLLPRDDGTVLIGDNGNYRLRRLTLATGQVDTFAGVNSAGSVDGLLQDAKFVYPTGMAADAAGNLYVSDISEHVIRRISASGVVSTLAGKPGESGSSDGTGAGARFYGPAGIAMDSQGNLIVADAYNGVIRRVTPAGVVTTLAGKAGDHSYVNGTGIEARLVNVWQLAIDRDDNVFFTDGTHAIRRLAPSGEVTTYSGAPYSPGNMDDVGAFARFNQPGAVALDARGNVYVADTGNSTVRRIGPDGYVTTVIGRAGVAMLQSGINGTVNGPYGLAVTRAGRLIMATEGAIIGD